MPKPWPVVETTLEGDFKIFTLRRERAVSPRTGVPHDFYVMDTRDWVNVVPVTDAGELVMVRQYRHGVKRVTLEIPGGLVDEGEDPAEAGARELREETGFEGTGIRHLGSVDAQPALQTNRCHTYLVTGARRVSDPAPDAGEDLRVLTVPLAEIPERVRLGEITHGLVLTALYWYHLNGGAGR